jgi:limonene-1,2-epoxide hydrolase
VSHPREEVEAAVTEYLKTRQRIDDGDAGWAAMADLFTDDAVYIDPAWGRIEGNDAIREFMVDSMTGLEDWRFPILFTAIEGDHVVVKRTQVLPGTRADGSHYTQSGVSTLVYGGGGRFRYAEDLLNMAHVLDDLRESKWRPGPGAHNPPSQPNRDFSIPD